MDNSIKSVMTQNVISVLPDTTLIQAVTIILSSGFNGIPVTNKEGVLVGILTEYDIVYKKNNLHTPIMQQNLTNQVRQYPRLIHSNSTMDNEKKCGRKKNADNNKNYRLITQSLPTTIMRKQPRIV